MNSFNYPFNSLIFKIIVLISTGVCFALPKAEAQQVIDTDYINALYDSAKVHYRNADYNRAVQDFNKILSLKNKIPEDINPEYFKVYNWLGLIYKKQGILQKAIKYYRLAINTTSDDYYKSLIGDNLANVFTLVGDYSKAIYSYENTLSILEKSNNQNRFDRIANNYHNQGYAYYKMGKYEISLNKYLKSIQILEENNMEPDGESFASMGTVYQKLGKFDNAADYHRKAITYNEKDLGKNHYKTALAYMYYAEAVYSDIGNFETSYKLYKRSLEILLNTLGYKHHYTSYCLTYIGNLYYKTKNYKQALHYYQQSLISKIYSFNDSSVYTNPNPDVFPDLDLLDILKLKAQALEKLAEQENKKLNLKAALVTLELTVDFIEQLRTGYLYESSKLQLAAQEHETYHSIINIANSLYEISNNIEYAEIAFKYSELSKYAILRELKNEEMARKIAGVPDSTGNNERRLQERIGSIRMQIEEESKLEIPDRLKIDQWNKKIFSLTQELEDLIKELESEYPAYYEQKYSHDIVNINQMQNTMDEKEAILEYVLEENTLYTFVITKDTFQLIKLPVGSVFYSNLESYKTILHRKHSSPYIDYRNAAYNLYEKLIKPAEPYLKDKNLLIIPDNKMEFIAFEALIDKPYKQGDKGDYRKESYILRKYSIGYAYSATLFSNSKNKEKRRRTKFLGIAPSYINSKDSLPNLPLGVKSVRKLALLTSGKSLVNDNASKNNFKKYSSKYDIIHFYAHGFEDTLNPTNSKLCLSPQVDTINDDYLYAWEVYNMQLNAKLVVLASCYSGAGKLSKGEGVLSIGRSFINAGSLSVLTALWSATYESTIFELNVFYRNLLKGKRKDDALRLAKLKYLEKTDPINAHPRFWASLVITGNQDALYHNFFLNRILLIICIIILFFIVRKKKLFIKSS